MVIVRVNFHDWNGNDRDVEITSDMCSALKFAMHEEKIFAVAISYIRRRYTECMNINSVEIIAN